MISREEFKRGFWRLASGVSVITAALDEQKFGLVATSVSSLSDDPPTLLVCVNKNASSHDAISRSGCFCVNVLRSEDHGLAAKFGSAATRSERFSEAGWTALWTGAPAYAHALVVFDCSIDKVISHESHTIFIARIVMAQLGDHQTPNPLLYFDGAFRHLEHAAKA